MTILRAILAELAELFLLAVVIGLLLAAFAWAEYTVPLVLLTFFVVGVTGKVSAAKRNR